MADLGLFNAILGAPKGAVRLLCPECDSLVPANTDFDVRREHGWRAVMARCWDCERDLILFDFGPAVSVCQREYWVRALTDDGS